MDVAKATRLRHCGDSAEARAFDGIADRVGAIATPPAQPLQVIRAELSGSDRCSGLGITANCAAPLLGLCRKLIDAGANPATPLEVWRGQVLCLRVRTIGDGALLTVENDRHGRPRFRRWRSRGKGYGAGALKRRLKPAISLQPPSRQRAGRRAP